MEKMERRKRKNKRFCHFSAISRESRKVPVLKKKKKRLNVSAISREAAPALKKKKVSQCLAWKREEDA
jgi:uncharacterized protein (DUF169 family)